MRIERALVRMIGGFGLAAGLSLAAAAHAQVGPAPVGPPPPVVEEAPPAPSRTRMPRVRGEVRPYLEVAQVLSAEFGDGDVLTYTSVAAGVDGRIRTRRITAAMSYRYERRQGWSRDVADSDTHSGVAQLNAEVVPGLLDFDAGALATRTAGEGRALGVTARDRAVNVYSAYAGPTLSTRAGPVSVNAAYRLGYVNVDDDRPAGARTEDFDESVAHTANVGVGMESERLPFDWTVNAGYGRENSGGSFDQRFEAAYVRADVVVPVTPTLAVTGAVGYENMEGSQRDIARDANGVPIITPDGRVTPDRSGPRLLTYDFDGLIYDGGIIWRPSSRSSLQARVGRRYGGTTVTAALQHRFNSAYGVSAEIYDSVQSFGSLLTNDLSALPGDFQIERNPLTGGLGLGGCVFGADPGSGVCLDRSLQSIRGNSFRLRGASLVFSGHRGLWDFGVGGGYSHRRYFRPDGPEFDFVPTVDQNVSVYGSVGRRLTRTSSANLGIFASWFDSDSADADRVFSTGATLSYRRTFLLDRLQLLAALGLYHSDDGNLDSTVASGLLGLRYNF